MKKVTVLILNYNGSAMLRRFLPQVIACTDSEVADIVVADNGSTDGSIDLLRTDFPQVRVIPLDKNYGFAEGYDRAMSEVTTPYTLLLNSDAAPTAPGWLLPLIEYMDTHTDCAACQPKILAADRPGFFEAAGAAGGYLDRNGYPYCRGRVFSAVEQDLGQYDDIARIDWAGGAAMMVRTRLFNGSGGFDPLFFAHMEEIDLCWRWRNQGWSIAVVPRSAVCHLGGGTLAVGSPQKTYLNFRNNLLMMYKNLPHRCRRRKLIWRRLLDTLAWGLFVLTGKWHHAAAVIRAHRDYRRMLRHYKTIPSPTENLLKNRPNILIKSLVLRVKR